LRSLLAALTVLAALAALYPVSAGGGGSWVEFQVVASDIVAYDFDGDGYDELLLLPDYVVDNYVLLRSPYPQYRNALLADVDLDGERELVLYTGGTYLAYKGTRLVGEFQLGSGEPVVDLLGRAVAVGNRVLFNMSVYEFSGAGKLYPAVAGGKLFAVYRSGNALYIEDTEGNRWLAYGDAIEPIGAVVALGKAYILGRAPLGGTVYIEYKLGGEAEVVGFTVELARAVAWAPATEEFIAVSEDGFVYRVSKGYLVLAVDGRYVGFDGYHVYLYSGGKLAVYRLPTRATVAVLELPEPRVPDVFGGTFPTVAVRYGYKTYVYSLLPEPRLRMSLPGRAVVGEPVRYSLTAFHAVAVTLSVNGTALPLEGSVKFNRSGVYVFTASASNGIVTVTETYALRVDPRPLHLSLEVKGTPVAYVPFGVVVKAYDGLTGSAVEGLYCSLSVGGASVAAESWREVMVRVEPAQKGEVKEVLKATCGDGSYYAVAEHSATVAVRPAVANATIDYLGGGVVVIRFVGVAGEPVPGAVKVYLNGRFVSSDLTPYRLEGLVPGDNLVVVEFAPEVPGYANATYRLQVHYAEDVALLPPEHAIEALVADRVEVLNNTVLITVTEPPVTRTVAQPDLLQLFGALVAGAVAGVVAMLFLSRARAPGRKGSAERELEMYEMEMEKA